MAEMTDEHFEVVSNNRGREYEKTKKTLNIIKTLLNKSSPANAAAMPEKEFNKEITTGISPPPIGRTKPTPPSITKTR